MEELETHLASKRHIDGSGIATAANPARRALPADLRRETELLEPKQEVCPDCGGRLHHRKQLTQLRKRRVFTCTPEQIDIIDASTEPESNSIQTVRNESSVSTVRCTFQRHPYQFPAKLLPTCSARHKVSIDDIDADKSLAELLGTQMPNVLDYARYRELFY